MSTGLLVELLGPPCTWTENEEGVYRTRCHHLFQFTDGDPLENQFTYCPYCGQPLVTWKYLPPPDLEE